MEIKSLQVPGERAQSAERAEERRRDKRFPFKLIPLRPSRFPSQDLQKAIKIWPCGSDEKLGGKKAKKKDCFDEGGREALKELVGRGGVEAEKPVEADQGKTRETRGVGTSSEGASRDRSVCQPEQGGPPLSAIKPVLHV